MNKKLIPIPLGIAPTFHGNIKPLTNILSSSVFSKDSRDILCYLNFSEKTYPFERNYVKDLFLKKGFCFYSQNKNYEEYFSELSRAVFVLSPRGNRLDCYRTWESILCGAIPIVRKSTLDPLFSDLPVLIVGDWRQVTKKSLMKAYKNMQTKKFSLEKMKADYWIDLIRSYQENI